MKKLYSIILILSVFLLTAQEKPCPPSGITTNPSAPLNTEHPNYTNDFFDWTEEFYDVHFVGGATTTQANPYTVNNGGVTGLYLTGDYEPEDGWELIYVDLGKDKNGLVLPSPVRSGQLFFVLYNKYRSILRVFVAIDELAQNNLTEIELSLQGDYNTALLASSEKVRQPLKSFDPSIIATNVQKFTNGAQDVKHWHYADFSVSYDPCTCNPPSQNLTGISILKFEVNLIDQASINLRGFSNGTIENTVNKNSSVDPSSTAWNNFYGTVQKAGKAVKSGQKVYKGFNDFKSDVKNTSEGKADESKMKPGLDNLGTFLADANKALKLVPYASEALAIIDFFVGGTKKNGPQKVLLQPMAMQLEHRFTGEVTSSFNYIRKPIFTPGSSFTPNDSRYSFGDDRYPIYNEVLGLYSILKEPEIDLWKGYASRDYELLRLERDQYVSIAKKNTNRTILTVDPNSIQIVLNEASNMTLKDAYIQYVYTIKNTAGVYFDNNSDGIMINDTTCVSPLIPLSCANSRAFAVDVVQEREIGVNVSTTPDFPALVDVVYIQLILDLESPQGNKILHKSTWYTASEVLDNYEAEGEIVETFEINNFPKRIVYDWFNNQWLNPLNFGYFNADQNLFLLNESIENDNSASTSILIENCSIKSNIPNSQNNGYTDMLAGEWIEVLPNSEIKPNSTLAISLTGMNCNSNYSTQATNVAINNICEGIDYQNQKFLTKRLKANSAAFSEEDISISIFPNPADDYIRIDLSKEPLSGALQVDIYNVTGTLVKSQSLAEASEQYQIETSNLAPGVYLIQATADGMKAVEQVVIH